jgi:hypothetical protein
LEPTVISGCHVSFKRHTCIFEPRDAKFDLAESFIRFSGSRRCPVNRCVSTGYFVVTRRLNSGHVYLEAVMEDIAHNPAAAHAGIRPRSFRKGWRHQEYINGSEEGCRWVRAGEVRQ